MKLPASRAHVTILLDRESAIVVILDLLVPRSGGFCPRMSRSTRANLTLKTPAEFYKSDIFFEKRTWLFYHRHTP
ncbi:hypothetical protein [Rhizobium leguminosarum]|uniref:hypothetical protein n=1 Tax=Rhizobium leguminosarum TaxID=384 RepID=UPI0013EE503D|nr:hypothetical protein [Rhizobium leguminosarum]